MEINKSFTARGIPISDFAADWLRTAFSRISPDDVADRVWHELFHAKDQASLGGDLSKAWKQSGTAGMWMKARGCSLEEAVIDIAERFEFISGVTANRLRNELKLRGTLTGSKETSAKPRWDDSTGELTLHGEVVRRVRLTSDISNIRKILKAFQTAKWPRRIQSPFDEQHRLHETLRSLNRGLQKLRFRAAEAKYVFWELTSQ